MKTRLAGGGGRLTRILAAVLLSAAALAYGSAWAWYSLQTYDGLSDWLGLPRGALAGRVVELGFDLEYRRELSAVRVMLVKPGSPAEVASIAVGDRIVAVDGRSVRESAAALGEVYLSKRPADAVFLTVERDGVPAPVVLRAVFRHRTVPAPLPVLLRALFGSTVLFPFVMLAVALPVLFYRLEDAHAWRLALLFACFIAAPRFPDGFAGLGAAARLATAYRSLGGGVLAALFYFFFATFPARSGLDRRAPWLKWALVAVGLAFGVSDVTVGGDRVVGALQRWLGADGARLVRFAYGYGSVVLGLAALVGNLRRSGTPDARRKVEVIVWGTVVGVVPAVALGMLGDLGWRVPDWIRPLSFLALFLFPLSFGYAVVRHRVLEIPVLLKHSARYLLVRRGFGVLLGVLGLVATALFAISFTRLFRVEPALAASVGVGFGLALISLSAPGVRRATRRIDRAFFRGAYDARVILEQLADSIRSVDSPARLAEALQQQLGEALQPAVIVVYLRSPDGVLRADGAAEPAQLEPDAAGLAALAEDARARDFVTGAGETLVAALGPLAPECLVPVAARGRLLGIVALGQRLSEEPYSGEDKRLLAAVAAQAAVVLENLELAAHMAERLQAERRAAHEMELARQVQARLLPREGRRLRSLECAGRCVQARAVGGDYFDFLDGGDGRLGLVLADVSGKGFAAALLMASLQASLRTLSSRPLDLVSRLQAVNALLLETTEPSRYATLFVGEYEDSSRRLQYVNCGHNPPLVVRAKGGVERLAPTAMVVGLVEDWTCERAETVLCPGDLLVLYSDGISEAADGAQQEFGDTRLAEAVRAHGERPLPELLDRVFEAVRHFSDGEQADDQTLVIARQL